jgi:hypothetical protein
MIVLLDKDDLETKKNKDSPTLYDLKAADFLITHANIIIYKTPRNKLKLIWSRFGSKTTDKELNKYYFVLKQGAI